MEFILRQTTIKLRALRWAQARQVGILWQAIPQILRQLNTLGRSEMCEVKEWGGHVR